MGQFDNFFVKELIDFSLAEPKESLIKNGFTMPSEFEALTVETIESPLVENELINIDFIMCDLTKGEH